MRLYVLRTGWADIDVATYMPSEPERGAIYSSPIVSYVIVGDVVVLVDTGPAPEHMEDPYSRTGGPEMKVLLRPEDQVVARLAEIGLEPDDIDIVITTHFDIDHCGGHRFFPNARHLVQAAQHEYALSDPERCPPDDWRIDGLEYELLDGDTEVVSGVTVLATPGHVPGHQSVLVELPGSGPFVIGGDAAVTERMFEEELVEATHDRSASVASIRRLKELRDERGARILIGHDTEAFETKTRISPEFYD
jgi:N-acyl homoserine lactone hydrolase